MQHRIKALGKKNKKRKKYDWYIIIGDFGNKTAIAEDMEQKEPMLNAAIIELCLWQWNLALSQRMPVKTPPEFSFYWVNSIFTRIKIISVF